MEFPTSKCCGATIAIINVGSYDPDDDGVRREWIEAECQECGESAFQAL